jgi:menaquinone-9 beta-reductase
MEDRSESAILLEVKYDLAIIGGGLAGLSLAILQAKAGFKVILFEKKEYPFHRVCGEYISLESWDFLISLGVSLPSWQLPIIKKLEVSSPAGTIINAKLDLGGFGISRFKLDFELAKIAKSNGVVLLENTQVNEVEEKQIFTNKGVFEAKNVIGSFGKRSNLDVEWKRSFIQKNRTSLNQYIGVKYHLRSQEAKDHIWLHNFKDGYCGFSAIEDDLYCLCYLTTKANLKASGNSIEKMEEKILSKNPHIRRLLQNTEKCWDSPQVISQISFEKKEVLYEGIPMIGDASGSIAPLCGNGMSMAFQGAFLIHQCLLDSAFSPDWTKYQKEWKKYFGTRLWVGRKIQSLFGNEITTELLIRFFKLQPYLLTPLIKLTHGKKIGY